MLTQIDRQVIGGTLNLTVRNFDGGAIDTHRQLRQLTRQQSPIATAQTRRWETSVRRASPNLRGRRQATNFLSQLYRFQQTIWLGIFVLDVEFDDGPLRGWLTDGISDRWSVDNCRGGTLGI